MRKLWTGDKGLNTMNKKRDQKTKIKQEMEEITRKYFFKNIILYE